MEKAIRRLVILGASGHGKVVADIAVKNGYTDIVFLDDDPSLTSCAGYPVLGPISMLAQTMVQSISPGKGLRALPSIGWC